MFIRCSSFATGRLAILCFYPHGGSLFRTATFVRTSCFATSPSKYCYLTSLHLFHLHQQNHVFIFFCLPSSGSLWLPFGSLWLSFGFLWRSFNFLWLSFGWCWLPFGCLWLPFAFFWLPLGFCWFLLAPFGSLYTCMRVLLIIEGAWSNCSFKVQLGRSVFLPQGPTRPY